VPCDNFEPHLSDLKIRHIKQGQGFVIKMEQNVCKKSSNQKTQRHKVVYRCTGHDFEAEVISCDYLLYLQDLFSQISSFGSNFVQH
jgi:hypothetical protein